ncbi:CaiB/BaiF CoA transferase family protein [Novispirillum itersonii]|uniref:Succinyl-CoA:(S)-malate CoA-transferase subunit A/succinyl-CoA:(S)-malate CoA-transferase subunit B n=1 Tax=Novispirillum itersonii TaxID=189 RepID=A0A7X0DKZ2_NOVIT|nr:CoA transferase [Novispirillum itersonii]MBB6209446.1 succinyl-CoA:(S)-malate CoA-transferase subunit A/succinyl-CoA:(S)-malate CoA-transferase subunit B [Novispirillum itersonii]
MTSSSARRPLDGLRVLDAATFIAGPYSAGLLAEFGAEVIKIEQPGEGDPMRRFGTPTACGDTLAWLSEARNKKSVTLDLRAPEGAALFRDLAAVSDVVIENFRPGTLEKWGLGWQALHAVNPRLVMLRVSGYGQTGPYRDRPGFARIAHAVGGLSYLAGMPGGVPVTPGSTSLGDYISGLYGVVGILLALRHRDATGEGQYIDVALFESVFRMLDELAPAYDHAGTVRDREGSGTLNACPHGHFECGDGRWMAIACTNDKMFARLCQAMQRPDLASRFGRVADRLRDRMIVDGEVAAWTRSAPRDAILEICLRHEVPSGPINSIADIFTDPHFAARETIVRIPQETLGSVAVPATLPRLSATPGRIDHLGPALGADTDAVLRTVLNLSETQLADLRQRGIL